MDYDTLDQAQDDLTNLEAIQEKFAELIKLCRHPVFASVTTRSHVNDFVEALECAEHDEFNETYYSVKDAVAEMSDEAPDDASMRAWDNGRKL